MLSRLLAAVVLAAPLLLAQAATAREATKEPTAKEPSVAQSAARERQKKCGAEWRALSATEKKAQGPKWPQYYSKCVKRLKEQKA
jgi:Ni/Co efflux regulator RcnB